MKSNVEENEEQALSEKIKVRLFNALGWKLTPDPLTTGEYLAVYSVTPDGDFTDVTFSIDEISRSGMISRELVGTYTTSKGDKLIIYYIIPFTVGSLSTIKVNFVYAQ